MTRSLREEDAALRRFRSWMLGARLAAFTTTAFATAAALAPRAAAVAQEQVEQIVIGGVTPRFALPECVPRRPDEASQAACRTLTQVLRNDLRFEGLFQFVPDSLVSAIPPLNPDAPQFEDWKGIGAKILVATRAGGRGGRAHRRGAGLLRGLRRHDARPALLGQARQPARLRPPGLRRHHDPDPVQGRRAHADRLRLRPRRHEGTPLEGALHRRLRRLQPAPGDGERLAQHPARLAPGREGPRLRLLPPGVAAPLPREDLRGPERLEPERREGRQPGLRARLQPRREEPRLRQQPGGQHGRLGRRARTAAVPAASPRRSLPTPRRAGARPGRRSRSRPAARERRRSGPWTARASTCAA